MEYKSFGEYLKSLPENTVFRLWEKKQIFTPYEQAEKFTDQSIFVNDVCDYVIIKDVINLPDGDLLLTVSDTEINSDYMQFYKLSEIALAKAGDDSISNLFF